jgi:transcriptional regulator with XRE-family HTH domain
MLFSNDMQEKEYRHGLIDAQIEIDLPFQIRALRKQQDLTQPQLADLTGMKQSRISRMEKPGGASFTLETLRRLAKAFDVALIVRFARFGELVKWSKEFEPDSFVVPSFDKECQVLEEREKVLQSARTEGKLVTIARPRIRWSGAGRRTKPTRSPGSARPRKLTRTEQLRPLAMATGGESIRGWAPSRSNNTCSSLALVGSGNALVGSGNACSGSASKIGGLDGNR